MNKNVTTTTKSGSGLSKRVEEAEAFTPILEI